MKSIDKICPICNSTNIIVFVEIAQVPVHCNLLWSERGEALSAAKGDIHLASCRDCGHIFNLSFNPELVKYDRSYENSLHFSARFSRYAKSLANRLVDRHDLSNKVVIEIGCGDGKFLSLICKLGRNRGIGFDPSYSSNSIRNEEGITIIRDFYSERYAHYGANLIVCRQVLEHVYHPTEFLTTIRQAVGSRVNTTVFFEVPNVLYTLRDLAIWDIIYEHYSYFSSHSIMHLFKSCGFEVCNHRESFQGQFLCIEASPSGSSENNQIEKGEQLEDIANFVSLFAQKYRNKVKSWQSDLQRFKRLGQRAVVWGAGSKGVTFLNTLRIQDQIEYVVDISPRKQGKYVVGTGQQIVPPKFLQNYQPDIIIVMNPIYQGEIQQLTKKLGLQIEFLHP